MAIPKTGTPRLLTGLETGRRHRLVIRDAGRPIESFSFSFEGRGGTLLCLAYGPWYQTWTLDPPHPGAKWCRCKEREA